MKFTISTFALLFAVAFTAATFTGCGDTSEKGGDTTKNKEGEVKAPEKTFTITAPSAHVDVTQGKDDTVAISVNRGDKFLEEVTVEFKAPAGITCDPAKVVVKKDETEAKTLVKVDADTKEGEHVVNVTATPAKGDAVDQTFVVEVAKAE